MAKYYPLTLLLLLLLFVSCLGEEPAVGEMAPAPAISLSNAPPTLPPTFTPSPPAPIATLIADQYTYDDLIHVFDYDSQKPLAIQQESVSTEENGAKLVDISYAGAASERVSAFLVVPLGEGPFAGVVFMHWGGGSKYSFLEEAILLANSGVLSLLVDGTWNPEPDNFKRTIINLRRGTDLLVARPDVDSSRLGYVGHSWGATFGGVLTDVDRRFKTYILIAGPPYFSNNGIDVEMVPFDGIRYVGQAAPAPLFFQYANQDYNLSQEVAELYFEAASEPKEISWYDTNHRFNNEEAQQDRLEWLSIMLDLQ